jgi:hypothetical protein
MRPAKPIGQPTRGKTAANRLRKTDAFLAVAYPERLTGGDAVYVDVGFGAHPITSVETLARLRRINQRLTVVAVDIDPERVRAAASFARPGLDVRLGGFNLPVRPGERVVAVRALNVLRQYGEAAVADAVGRLGAALAPGGLLLEGTSDPTGRLLAFELHERRGAGVERVALVLAPSLRHGFEPRDVQAVLPKRHIHRAEPGGDVDRFFAAWQEAWRRAHRDTPDPREAFARAARHLAERHGYPVDRRDVLLRRGFLALGAAWPAASPPRGAAVDYNRRMPTPSARP